MKTLKLSVKEISELQPTDTEYAAEKGDVIGGIEITGEPDSEALAAKAAKYFGAGSEVFDSGSDGDGCMHVVIIKPLRGRIGGA